MELMGWSLRPVCCSAEVPRPPEDFPACENIAPKMVDQINITTARRRLVSQISETMSKRNSDGDVLLNRLAVGVAQEQSLLASLMGRGQQVEPPDETPDAVAEDEDLMFTADFEQCVLQS
jgi:hypothetical protein